MTDEAKLASLPMHDGAELRPVRDGLRAALADPSLEPARKELRLTGATVLTDEDYRRAFRD